MRTRVVVTAGLLCLSAAVAEFPAGQQGAAQSWLAVDLGLLALTARGSRVACTVLRILTVWGALVLCLAGAAQVREDPSVLLHGLLLTAATVVLSPLQPPDRRVTAPV